MHPEVRQSRRLHHAIAVPAQWLGLGALMTHHFQDRVSHDLQPFTSVHGVKCILYNNFPLEIRLCFLHDAQEGLQDWLVIPVHLAQDRLQGDMEQLDCEIQIMLAVLKEWKTDLKAGSSSVY